MVRYLPFFPNSGVTTLRLTNLRNHPFYLLGIHVLGGTLFHHAHSIKGCAHGLDTYSDDSSLPNSLTLKTVLDLL